jgi:hypothetical protein
MKKIMFVLSLLAVAFVGGFLHHTPAARAQLVVPTDPLSKLGCGPYKKQPLCSACNYNATQCETVCNGDYDCVFNNDPWAGYGNCLDFTMLGSFPCRTVRSLF